MARTQEWVMFHTSHLILHPSQLVVLSSRNFWGILSENRQIDLLQKVQRLRHGTTVMALTMMWAQRLRVFLENLWCCASKHLFPLRALHVPGLGNRGADCPGEASYRTSEGTPLSWPLQVWLLKGTGWDEVDCLSLLYIPSRQLGWDPPLPATGWSVWDYNTGVRTGA